MIEEYLSRLQAELSGADPAIVQDALYDADEYLRAELADVPAEEQDAALTRIYENYGTPAEVASAYLDAERVVTPTPPPAQKTAAAKRNPIAAFFGIVVDPRAWGSLIYMLLAMLTGTIYFTLVVMGVSMSIGFAILIIGIPIMLLFLGIVRAVSLAEGRLVEALLGERMPRRPTLSPAEGGIIKRIVWWLKDYRTWTTMLYMLLMLPLGVLYFSVVVTAISFGISMFVGPIAQFVTNTPMIVTGDYGYFIEWWAVPFVWAFGLLVFVLTLHGAKLVGKLHAAFAKVMLVGRFSEADQAAA